MQSIAKKIASSFGILCLLHIVIECFFINQGTFANISIPLLVKLLVSFFIISCGIFCSFYYAENKKTRPIVYYIYLFGLTIFNFYDVTYHAESDPVFKPVLFDFLAALTITFVYHFIYQTYEPKKVKKVPKDIFCLAPIVAFVIKYILFLFHPNWTLQSNAWSSMTYMVYLLTIVILLSFFIYILAVYSRTQIMLFYYLLFGIFYSSFGPLFVWIKHILLGDNTTNLSEMITIFCSVSYIPFIISLSVFQYRSEKTNKLIRMFITFLGFCTLYVLIIDTIFDALPARGSKSGAALCLVFSPFVYKGLSYIVNRSLSIESHKTINDLEKFKNTLSETKSLTEVVNLSAETITELFYPKYMFFYMKRDTGVWYIPYTNTPDDYSKIMIKKHEQLKTPKHIHIFEDGCTVLTYNSNNEPIFKVFLSKKTNNDPYLPSELSLIQKYTDMTMNEILVQETKKIQTELKTVSHHSKLMDKEIQLAAYVQKSFYPHNISEINGWDFYYYCKPMAGVSGDLYDFYMRNKDMDGLGIFDVSGHGISSGLVTMLIRNIIRQEFYNNKNKPLNEVMNIIDARFRKEKNNIENFLTGILMRIEGNNIELVNAAHPYPIIYRKKENDVYFLDKTNTERSSMIGFNDMEPHFVKTDITLEAGDEIILYTDGINESIDINRQQYGLTRLLSTAAKNINLSVTDQAAAILEDIQNFVGENAEPSDDMTMIILRRK